MLYILEGGQVYPVARVCLNDSLLFSLRSFLSLGYPCAV